MRRNFVFKNFTPTRSESEACGLLYDMIWEKSPSDSWISAVQEREEESEYSTTIEIHSTTGNFQAFASHDSKYLSVNNATQKILNDLAKWRMHRFTY